MRLKPTGIAYRDLFRRYRILNIASYLSRRNIPNTEKIRQKVVITQLV